MTDHVVAGGVHGPCEPAVKRCAHNRARISGALTMLADDGEPLQTAALAGIDAALRKAPQRGRPLDDVPDRSSGISKIAAISLEEYAR